MAGLRSAARAEPGPPLLAVANEGPRPAPTGQTHHATRPSAHLAIVRGPRGRADEATDRLAIHIGLVAKLLVKRAAKQASSTRDLYEQLAAHIDDPQSRRRFTAAVEELSEP